MIHNFVLRFIIVLAWTPVSFASVNVTPPNPYPGEMITISYHGPYQATEFFIHYGFNGWNLELQGEGTGIDDRNDNHAYYKREKMNWRWDRRYYEIQVKVPNGAKALHMAFCWNTCIVGKWDNHNQLD